MAAGPFVTFDAVVAAVLAARARLPAARTLLVALSGIDGCGKGFITGQLATAFRAAGQRIASFNVDGWLNLPQVRFATAQPAEHFYAHAIRFDDMFAQLVLPLQRHRRVRVEADFAEETAISFRKQLYAFDDTDVILLEGIYLLKEPYRRHYDLSVWIECSFNVALERAVARAQEGMSEADTVRAYRTIYFPAQELHFARDQPRRHATFTLLNSGRNEPS